MPHNVHAVQRGCQGGIEQELELSVPTLIIVGLFNLFSPAEWVSGSNPGRRFVGEKAEEYLERHPKLTQFNVRGVMDVSFRGSILSSDFLVRRKISTVLSGGDANSLQEHEPHLIDVAEAASIGHGLHRGMG